MVNKQFLQKHSIFRVGEVFSVDGRTISIKVDQDKNLSHLLYQGEIIKNVSVGSYLKILKGFSEIIVKVEGEYIKENRNIDNSYHSKSEEFYRLLVVKSLGYFENGIYYKGVKELPLIGNECLLLDNAEFSLIHKFAKKGEHTLNIGNLLTDDNIPIEIGIESLFTSHIGIFGNTGSGKSYTLANIYNRLFESVGSNSNFRNNARFVIFDFNGEYSSPNVITPNKQVYKVNTRQPLDKIPLNKEDILKPEIIYILANATEKTQQPFINRALHLYLNVIKKENPLAYTKTILKHLVERVVCMSDYVKAKMLLDYLELILPQNEADTGISNGLQSNLEWHGSRGTFYVKVDGESHYFNSNEGRQYINCLNIYNSINNFKSNDNFIAEIVTFLYIQLIKDVSENKAINEHIIPAIKKLQKVINDFEKVFEINGEIDFWNDSYITIIDMNNANISMKKLIPLLISSKLYSEKKEENNRLKYLNIIIDEAHNILSYESNRESETWKDYRLETFEEIIKEGRKFGVFMTIASQRPSDISSTIISQLHNYFIHRLVNNKDIDMIEKAVSYLDKLSVETLPILPIGACVLSGIIADLPTIIQIKELDSNARPTSENISLRDSWFDN